MSERLSPRALLLLALAAPAPLAAAQAPVEWEPLVPDRITSSADVERDVAEDGSVLAVADFAPRETVVLDFECELTGISAVRVEALRHASLPAGGPGLGEGGVFKVAEVRVGYATSRLRRATEPVALVAALGLPPLADGPAWHATDSNVHTAWGPNGTSGEDLAAAFFLAEPLPDAPRGVLRVELDQTHMDDGCLGRLRVSVTRAPDAARALGAAGAEVDARLAAQVDDAIRRGVAALLRAQQLDGSWRYLEDPYRTGTTALAVYTLMKCGLARDHPSVVRGIEYVLAHPGTQVYVAATQVMALALHDPQAHRERIDELVEYLVDVEAHGWAYPYSPSAEVDLSNTQYALLALHAAAQIGVEVSDRVWRSAAKATLRHRERSRGSDPATGFGYRIGHDATGSMTAAGITILVLASEALGRNTDDFDDAARDGVAWLAREFSVTRNPQPSRPPGAAWDGQDRWWQYYLYGLERVAGLLDLDTIGPHDWYTVGATRLIEHQDDQGLWNPIAHGDAAQEQADTCFALLFLSRATGATTGEQGGRRRPLALSGGDDEEVLVRAVGSWPWRAWIQNYSEDALDDAGWSESRGLRLAEVRWELVDADGEPLEVLERIEADPERDALLERFPVELRFADRGSHRVRATVVALTPDGERRELRSTPVDLATEFVDRDELLRYAAESNENLIADVPKRVTASSELDETWAASKAADGRQSLGWISSDSDPLPWLRIELEDPVRANTLLLSRAHEPWSTGPWRTGRVARVAVSIDGRKPFEVDLVDDDWTKTRIDLGRRRKIDRIELQVRAVTRVHPDHPDYAGVGFGEVELRDAER